MFVLTLEVSISIMFKPWILYKGRASERSAADYNNEGLVGPRPERSMDLRAHAEAAPGQHLRSMDLRAHDEAAPGQNRSNPRVPSPGRLNRG